MPWFFSLDSVSEIIQYQSIKRCLILFDSCMLFHTWYCPVFNQVPWVGPSFAVSRSYNSDSQWIALSYLSFGPCVSTGCSWGINSQKWNCRAKGCAHLMILVDIVNLGLWQWGHFTGASFLSAPLPLGLGLIQNIYWVPSSAKHWIQKITLSRIK